MKIKIGKLMILWGDPIDLIREEIERKTLIDKVKRKIAEVAQMKIVEENEPSYIKEVKEYLRQGRKLEAVKACLKERKMGLRDARDECDSIEEKMNKDAKN